MAEDSVSGVSLKTRGYGVRLVDAALRARAIDPAPVLQRAGLSLADLDDGNRCVPAAAEYRLIEFAAQAADDPAFGLHLVDRADPRDWGMLYYLVSAASRVRDALLLGVGHLHLVTPVVEPVLAFKADGGATVEAGYLGIRRRELKHAVEFAFGFGASLLRSAAGPGFRFDALRFEHERTIALDEFERFFGCPVTFGAPSDRAAFSNETLELPVHSADPDMLKVLEPLAQRARREAQSASPRPLRVMVDIELRRLLSSGNGRIESVANALGVSVRSLERKLAAEGTTFSGVIDDLRRTLSLDYLADPGLSVGQIARRVGYSEPSAFTNAFRRWAGVSPSQARADPALLHRLRTRT